MVLLKDVTHSTRKTFGVIVETRLIKAHVDVATFEWLEKEAKVLSAARGRMQQCCWKQFITKLSNNGRHNHE
tara:strand:+ start:1968 stop:2183 length:216 start_codon:yes stop_codon:yes gene_type:complete